MELSFICKDLFKNVHESRRSEYVGRGRVAQLAAFHLFQRGKRRSVQVNNIVHLNPLARPIELLSEILPQLINCRMSVISVNDHLTITLLKRNMYVTCRADQTAAVFILRYVLRMDRLSNLSNTLTVPKLTASAESAPHVCFIYSTNTVCHCVHILSTNIQQEHLEQFLVKVEKVNGRMHLHVLVHYNILDVSVVNFAALNVSSIATVATTGLFLLHRTSSGLLLAQVVRYSPPLSPSALNSPILRLSLHYRLCNQHLLIFCLPIIIRKGRCRFLPFRSLLLGRGLLTFVSRPPRGRLLLLYNNYH